MDKPLSAQWDAITPEQLRQQGGLKWVEFPDAIGAFVAEMDFGTAEPITKALVEAVVNNHYGYLPGRTVAALRQAYVDFAARNYGWDLRPEQVRTIPDVLTGITAIVQFLMPDDAVIILPTPTYMPFLTMFGELGKKVIQVPMLQNEEGRYSDDLVGIEQALKAYPGKAWLVLVNPHNPTGRVRTSSELTALAETVTKHHGRVISDEIHAPLVYAPHRHIPYATVSPAASAHSITLTSASKAWNLAGLKTALLLLTNPNDQQLWQDRGGWTEHQTATLGVVAATAAYTQGEPWLAEVLNYLGGNRNLLADYLATELPRVKWYPPQGTYLAWLDLRDYRIAANPAGDPDAQGKSVGLGAFLLDRAHVAVTDGEQCGAPGFIRLNFATPRPVLQQTLIQINAALAEL